MTEEKPSLEELRRTRNMLVVVLVIVVLVAGLVTVGFATKLKKDNSQEQPSPPFRITNLADQEKLCEAIKESDDFNFADSATIAVYVSCQDDGGRSVFNCVGTGTLSPGIDLCTGAGFKVCPCDSGQIIDATNLDGVFTNICADEIDPENPICVELEGDLEGLLSATLSPISSPSLNPTNSPTQNPTSLPTAEPFRITNLADQEKLCEAIKEADDFNFANSETTPVYVSCQDDGGRSAFSCVGTGTLSEGIDLCFNNGFKVCPCDPGKIIDATNLDGVFTNICADEIDPNNALCIELEGNLEGLLES